MGFAGFGFGGIGITAFFASPKDPAWRFVRSCAVTSDMPDSSCSTSNGPAPRRAAPAASPCHAGSIRATSLWIWSARSL